MDCHLLNRFSLLEFETATRARHGLPPSQSSNHHPTCCSFDSPIDYAPTPSSGRQGPKSFETQITTSLVNRGFTVADNRRLSFSTQTPTDSAARLFLTLHNLCSHSMSSAVAPQVPVPPTTERTRLATESATQVLTFFDGRTCMY